MKQPTAEQVAQRAANLELLDMRQLQEIWGTLGSRAVPLSDLLQLLVRKEYLTNYQVERLIKGERSGFFYGRYRVLYLVGSGTFARVFRAVHRDTGEIVAIKVLRKRYSDNAGQSNQFLREGRVGITLRHPNIVPTFDVISDGKYHFLVMEFVEGWNLRDFVRIRKLVDPLQATRLMMNMAEGLRYAAERGLAHRDLKLSNVLVTSSGQAKLVDFGLAAADESLSEDMLSLMPNTRTVDYAALERATGVRKDDARSDIFFLGCIYYHMLTGQAPLPEAKDRLQRLSRARFFEIPPIQNVQPNMPHWVTMVVNKSMCLDPPKRYQTAAALLADLAVTEAHLIEDAESGKLPTEDETAYGPDMTRRSVMVVESNPKMQDIFRAGFKRAGYRVLVTSDVERAMNRLRQDGTTADCVLFSAQELGDTALNSFNALANDNKTRFIRALLLLDHTQEDWKSRVLASDYRVVLSMPLKMKELRAAMSSLLKVEQKK
ncbi:MAG: protein kinase [Thermoguttaceae bacterium]|jgi:serine/threonine-protein kinase